MDIETFKRGMVGYASRLIEAGVDLSDADNVRLLSEKTTEEFAQSIPVLKKTLNLCRPGSELYKSMKLFSVDRQLHTVVREVSFDRVSYEERLEGTEREWISLPGETGENGKDLHWCMGEKSISWSNLCVGEYCWNMERLQEQGYVYKNGVHYEPGDLQFSKAQKNLGIAKRAGDVALNVILVSLYERLIKDHPEVEALRFALLEVLERSGLYEKRIELVKKALKDPILAKNEERLHSFWMMLYDSYWDIGDRENGLHALKMRDYYSARLRSVHEKG